MQVERFHILEALCPKLFEEAETFERVNDEWGRFIGCQSSTGKRFTAGAIYSAIADGMITRTLEITPKGTVAYQDALLASRIGNSRRYTADELRRVRLEWRGRKRSGSHR